jgi:hypothetical protein
MKIPATVLLFALCGAFPAAAETTKVPKELLTWYADAMGAYGDLVADIGKADDAKATSAAFRKATAAVVGKKLAVRYNDLLARYPDFFKAAESGNTNWNPPPEWLKAIDDYGKALQNYGQSMQKALAWAQDPDVAQALQDFSDAMGAVGGE